MLLSIWKRTLPVSLGSLIIRDWSESNPKVIFGLHFLKGIRPIWQIQFLTADEHRGEMLGCECVGID